MKENQTNESSRICRPRLTFYHPNAKGTGSAMAMELHPAHDSHAGCIMMQLANQIAIANRQGPTPTFARFDWQNSIFVKLDFSDLCRFLQVFRGECEDIDNGKGIYHRSPRAMTKIVLRHTLEPIPGYSLEVYRTPSDGSTEMRARIFLMPTEALGLCDSISGSMSVISFGIPVVLPHDTSAYEAQVAEMDR